MKDLNEVEGVKTTFGSPIYADNISTKTDVGVRNLEARGALVVGKTNTPEFGAGAQTFNEVFGITRNPWDTRMTCAGSSGGSAVALATGQVWLATGSDLGGSLRNPASFCSVVGFRPSPGRVPSGPGLLPLDTVPRQRADGPQCRRRGVDAGCLYRRAGRRSAVDGIACRAVPARDRSSRCSRIRVAWSVRSRPVPGRS